MKSATHLGRASTALWGRSTLGLAVLLLGLLLGLLLAGVAPAFAGQEFKVPGQLGVETKMVFGHIAFDALSVRIGGEFQPIAGDFDANGATDIFWFSRIPGPSYLWLADRTAFPGVR